MYIIFLSELQVMSMGGCSHAYIEHYELHENEKSNFDIAAPVDISQFQFALQEPFLVDNFKQINAIQGAFLFQNQRNSKEQNGNIY